MWKLVLISIIFPIVFTNFAFAQESNFLSEFFEGQLDISFETPEEYFAEVSNDLAAGSTIYDLGIYITGMAIYAVFVWHFYRFIARREIISIDYDKYDTQGKISPVRIGAYIAAHIFLFPLIIFVWFFIYSMFMFVLAKDMSTGAILLIAISVIGATRVTSYYKEDLAKDVGKLLPFALMGIFLTSSVFFEDTSNFFSLESFEKRFEDFPNFVGKVIEFVIIVVIIETVLRTIFVIKRKIIPAAEEKLEEQIEEQIDEKIKVHVQKIEKKQKGLEEKLEKETEEIEKKIEDETEEIEKKIEKAEKGKNPEKK